MKGSVGCHGPQSSASTRFAENGQVDMLGLREKNRQIHSGEEPVLTISLTETELKAGHKPSVVADPLRLASLPDRVRPVLGLDVVLVRQPPRRSAPPRGPVGFGV